MNDQDREIPAMYADVIIDISHEKVDRPFTYRVPADLQGSLTTGSAVRVPFGRGNKERTGYIIGFSEEPSCDPAVVKDIISEETDKLPAEAVLVKLAAWMRSVYGGTMYACLKTVLPAVAKRQPLVKKSVSLAVPVKEAALQLAEAIKKKQYAKERLLRELIFLSQPETTRQPGSDPSECASLQSVGSDVSIPWELVTGKLSVSPRTLGSMEEKGIIRITSREQYRNPVAYGASPAALLDLSDEQRSAVNTVLSEYDEEKRGVYLLHGITGSGKTEVYIRMIEGIIARGKQAIVLIPEIALTYQTLIRFYRHFGDRVSVMNSTLSPGEKYDQARRAAERDIDVIIGPRSALFTPFSAIGLIVIDEEHEAAYKSEQTPKYHARDTAVALAGMVPGGASVVLGSATPSLDSYYRAEKGEYRLLKLSSRLTGGALPRVEIADLRQELREGNRSIFSRALTGRMDECLSRGEQCMLFINRRGLAGFVSCRACGYVFKCPRCDVSLSEHSRGRLICHYCGHTEQVQKICPGCGSKYVMAFRAGTEQVEREVKKMYPRARVLRMDADTTRTKGSYERILSAFAQGEADVLVGTQMIVKGHDFPAVTLVGILAADMSLNAGDYRASERTFQLLTQAAGRAGRGELPGNVVIQTYQPEHYSIVHAAEQDYESFYREETSYRELLMYPPAAYLMAVQIFSGDEESGIAKANSIRALMERAEMIKASQHSVFIGPAPATISRIDNMYRFAVYVKSTSRERLSYLREAAEEALREDINRGISVQFDLNPMQGF